MSRRANGLSSPRNFYFGELRGEIRTHPAQNCDPSGPLAEPARNRPVWTAGEPGPGPDPARLPISMVLPEQGSLGSGWGVTARKA
jgi:hypothetical protein